MALIERPRAERRCSSLSCAPAFLRPCAAVEAADQLRTRAAEQLRSSETSR